MKTTTALIIESSDLTKDKNLKFEAFEAICNADLVIYQGRVIKDRFDSLASSDAKEEVKAEPQIPAGPVRRGRPPRVTPIEVVDAPPEPEPYSDPEPEPPAGDDTEDVDDTPAWALPPVNGPVG